MTLLRSTFDEIEGTEAHAFAFQRRRIVRKHGDTMNVASVGAEGDRAIGRDESFEQNRLNQNTYVRQWRRRRACSKW